jgi:ACR3 family arsenite efflux pump ArsB
MKALQAHLSRWLMGYAVAAMVVGLGLGELATTWTAEHRDLVTLATTVMVFLVIYPMMIGLKFEALREAGHNVKGLGLALGFNFVWAPLLGLVLAKIFLPDPLLAIGFLLVMVVPCSSMTVAYTGLAKGNVALATMAVALSFVVATIAVPAWMVVFASDYQVAVPISEMLVSIATVLIAPMILGFATRKVLTSTMGPDRFARLAPVFPIASMLAMFGIIVLIFFGKSSLIIDKWATVLLLLVPNALFIAITLAVVTLIDHRLRLPYGDHMAVVFASTGKNNGTAIAIAATAFSPMVAVPAATMPIFQVMLLIAYLKTADRIRTYFTPHTNALATPAASPPPTQEARP